MRNLAINVLSRYIEKDPARSIKRIINTIYASGMFKARKRALESILVSLDSPEKPWYRFSGKIKDDLNPKVRKKLISNFLLRAGLFTQKKRLDLRKNLQQPIPFAILIDPTSACNLSCIGCWAKDYDKTDSLSLELLDRIIREGKEIGIYVYLYSGGEPLIRKKDIIKLCEMHPECYFLAFTNGTLVDEKFAAEVARVGNFALAFSIEGFEDMTDFRRGKGTYKKVIKAMDIMRSHGNLFGFSATYHRLNTELMGSDEFLDLMEDQGCHFGWYFTYMPVGSDARTELIVSPEQREFMFHRIRKLRNNRPLFLMDFWNDGEFTSGCVAGGKQYMHINARGDVEPCAFIHYSSVNIKDTSVLEALRQPLFMKYRENQPFNQNHLRPCPCLDNPSKLRNMVNESGAPSTQLNDQESVEQLTSKCEEHAATWGPVADAINGKKKINGHKIEVVEGLVINENELANS